MQTEIVSQGAYVASPHMHAAWLKGGATTPVGDPQGGGGSYPTPDHFVWNTPNTAIQGAGFGITVTAKDSDGNTLTTYDGAHAIFDTASSSLNTDEHVALNGSGLPYVGTFSGGVFAVTNTVICNQTGDLYLNVVDQQTGQGSTDSSDIVVAGA
jgi:hypothetical protein